MACAGSFWYPRVGGVHSLFLFALVGSLRVPGDPAWTVLVAHGDLLWFPLRIDV